MQVGSVVFEVQEYDSPCINGFFEANWEVVESKFGQLESFFAENKHNFKIIGVEQGSLCLLDQNLQRIDYEERNQGYRLLCKLIK